MTDQFQSWRKFKPEETGGAWAWIQFKGTNLCADFHCPCGIDGHIDDDFAYFYRCSCGKVFELSGHIEAHEITREEADKEKAVVESVVF